MEKMKLGFIKVENERVPTFDYVFEQMMAQSCRIDRAKTLAVWAIVLSVLSLAGIVTVMALAL